LPTTLCEGPGNDTLGNPTWRASEVGNVGADKFESKRDRNGEVDGKLTFHDDIVFGNDLVDETAAPYFWHRHEETNATESTFEIVHPDSRGIKRGISDARSVLND
jgi:hypothetical protein